MTLTNQMAFTSFGFFLALSATAQAGPTHMCPANPTETSEASSVEAVDKAVEAVCQQTKSGDIRLFRQDGCYKATDAKGEEKDIPKEVIEGSFKKLAEETSDIDFEEDIKNKDNLMLEAQKDKKEADKKALNFYSLTSEDGRQVVQRTQVSSNGSTQSETAPLPPEIFNIVENSEHDALKPHFSKDGNFLELINPDQSESSDEEKQSFAANALEVPSNNRKIKLEELFEDLGDQTPRYSNLEPTEPQGQSAHNNSNSFAKYANNETKSFAGPPQASDKEKEEEDQQPTEKIFPQKSLAKATKPQGLNSSGSSTLSFKRTARIEQLHDLQDLEDPAKDSIVYRSDESSESAQNQLGESTTQNSRKSNALLANATENTTENQPEPKQKDPQELDRQIKELSNTLASNSNPKPQDRLIVIANSLSETARPKAANSLSAQTQATSQTISQNKLSDQLSTAKAPEGNGFQNTPPKQSKLPFSPLIPLALAFAAGAIAARSRLV